MSEGRSRYARIRSILEVPILNEKYWSKVPEVAADAIMLDLEDSATPDNKDLARDRIVEALASIEYFGGRPVIVRCNNLQTPWAHDDLAALGRVDAEFLVSYPKAETADEVLEVSRLLEAAGRTRGLHVMIETARAVAALYEIAAVPGVEGLHFGYVDLAADVGSRAFDEAGQLSSATYYARSKVAMAAAANALFATGGSLIPEFKDLEKVRTHVMGWAEHGYTACIAVSPAHLPLINEIMAPGASEIDAAKRVSEAYEKALEQGDPAAVLDGKVITMPDYRVAQRTLARASH